MIRRQSRPFADRDLPPEAETVTPPALDLLEHLETVFAPPSYLLIHNGNSTGDAMLRAIGEEAGKEKVLGYLRELIARSRGE